MVKMRVSKVFFLDIFASIFEYGNSLVYGIDGAGFSAYVLNYQHCLKCVLENQHSCDEISA